MKTPRSKNSKIQKFRDTSDASTERDSSQMMLAFDKQVELRETTTIPPKPKLVATKRKPTQYASVKRISLVYESSLEGRPCITSTKDAMDFFKQYWALHPANDQERFVVACLDTKHRVQCVVVVTIGTLDASLVHPREVFKPAFLEGSSAIVISHNHPSGNPDPSREDRQVTDRLTEAGKLLGIVVLDHIIHGDGTGQVLSIRETE